MSRRVAAQWLPRRVIIFTEYADTKRYLEGQLRSLVEHTDRGAERIGEAGDRDGLGELLRQTILVSPDARSLLRVLIAEPFDWVSWTADGELPREDIEALFDRVLAFTDPKERAAGLGLLGALATLEPARTLGVDAEIRKAKAGILADKGKVSALEAKLKAEGEYEVFRRRQDAEYVSDFDRVVEEARRLAGTAEPKALGSGKRGKKP
jgi:hypothetical protein